MSGIVGEYTLDGRPADPELVRCMAAEAPERGPDGTAFWSRDRVALGHQLLRSTPESLGETQPATLPGNRLVVACDGVLYNRQDLLRELARSEAAPRDPSSEPDSLLILRAYRKWGAACLPRLIGDFALVIWDSEKGELLAAVDPIGIRQLFYHVGGAALLFASEERQLLAAPGVSREIDPAFLRSFVAQSSPGDGRTAFREIKQLTGGHALTAKDRHVQVWRYWQAAPTEPGCRSEDEYAECFRGLLQEAVEARLRAPGPVACWLSGGLDSGSVSSMAGQLLRERQGISESGAEVHCLTAVFPGLSCDEREFARSVSDRHGLPHRFVPLENKGFLESTRRWLERQATPFLTLDPVFCETLMAETGQLGCRVCLSGLGGDEVLLSDTILAHLFRRMRWRLWWRELGHQRRPGWRGLARALVPFVGMVSPAPAVRLLGGEARWIRKLLGPAGHGRMPWWWGAMGRPDYDLGRPLGWLRGATRGDGWTAHVFAMRDRMCSRFGVEMRYPFFDRRIVEFMLGVPDDLYQRNGVSKLLLRKAMAGVLPDLVRERRGGAEYSDFFHAGLRRDSGGQLRELFECEPVSGRLLRTREMRARVLAYLEGEEVVIWPFFSAIAVEMWLRIHQGRGAWLPPSGKA